MLGIILFIVLPFYFILKKWIIPKKPFKIRIGISFLFFLMIIFLCGYKVPWFDKYPMINSLPDHTNKKEIRIEVIKVLSEFTKSDSLRFPIENTVYCCNGNNIENNKYKKNLKNITFYTSTVRKNKFQFSNPLINGLKGIGNSGGSTGDNSNDWDFHFTQSTRDYNKLKIAGVETVFKGTRYMESFYQINYPKSKKDTLFFIYNNFLLKAYIIK